jgi:hypothetical protein
MIFIKCTQVLSFQADLTNFCDFLQKLRANVRLFSILKWANPVSYSLLYAFIFLIAVADRSVLLQIGLGSWMTAIQYTTCSNN